MNRKTAVPGLLAPLAAPAPLPSLLCRVACAVLPNERLRLTLKRVVTGTLLVGLTAGFDCCGHAQPEPHHDLFSLSSYGAERGTTIPLIATLTFPNSDVTVDRFFGFEIESGPHFDVVDSNGGAGYRIGMAPPPRGVAMDFETGTLTIGQDAPTGPISFRVALHAQSRLNTSECRLIYAVRTFVIRVGPNAPEVLGPAVPSTARRGVRSDVEDVDVEIPARNAEDPTVICEDPAITVTGATFDAAAGRVRATLHIPSNARTGLTYLAVESPVLGSPLERNRSEDVVFEVNDGPMRPVVASLFPNYAESGGTLPLLVGGSDFMDGTILFRNGVEHGRALPLDTHVVRASVQVVPGPTSPTQADIAISSLGGRSDHRSNGSIVDASIDPDLVRGIRIVPPGTRGPRITRIVPDEVVTNTTAQVRIEGENLDLGAALEVVAVGSDSLGSAPVFRVLPGSARRGDFVIAEVVAASADDATISLGATGPMLLALRVRSSDAADGLVSNAKPVEVVARDAPPGPVLKSAAVGRIARGTDVVETIRGIRLHEVTDVFIESGGIERVGDFVRDPTGNSVTVTLRARADAALTGEAATNLFLETRTGGRSNPLGYRVVVASCDIPDVGTTLTLTGSDSTTDTLRIVTSAVSAGGDPSVTRIDVGVYTQSGGFRGFKMLVPVAPANLHAGSVPAQDFEFHTYGIGWQGIWSRSAARAVQVVDIDNDPTRVGLCIDVVLPAQDAGEVPSEVTVRGYVVLDRGTP